MSRISNLPRRNWTDNAERISVDLTGSLRTRNGTMILRPVQAVAIWEAYQCRGLFGNLRVGAGKTLVTGLLPVVLNAARPMLLVPASLVKDTALKFRELRDHWQIPHTIRVVSYSRLGCTQHSELINAYQPDLIIADEAQKLRHLTKSAAARRVARYMSARPATKFAALSGTLTKGSILDYWHLLRWALGDGAPIPMHEESVAEWAALLDAKSEERPNWDVLEPHFGLVSDVSQARGAFRERLESTPGVIISQDSFGGPLEIRKVACTVPAAVEPHLTTLRKTWRAPDGWDLGDARFEVWRVARQLALGFCYVHDPRPPEDWFAARRAWCSLARKIIEWSPRFDSEFQVAGAVALGHLGLDAQRVWSDWNEIKPTFAPNTVPLWFSDAAIERAALWGWEAPGLIWTAHVAFGERLAKGTGWAYYRDGGLDASGRPIERADPNQTAIVSVDANYTGRNLQPNPLTGWAGFARNLLVSPDTSGYVWEQLIGRTHRDGQTRPVTVDVWETIKEDSDAIRNALLEAQYTFETTKLEQKILGRLSP